MVGHGLSPSWKIHGRGQRNNNVPTCDTWWNGKAVFYNNQSDFFSIGDGTPYWRDTVVYEGFSSHGFSFGNKAMTKINTWEPQFTVAFAPGIFKSLMVFLYDNGANYAYDIFLAQDGPEMGNTAQVPTKIVKLLSIPQQFIEDPILGTIPNPVYPNSGIFSTADALNIELPTGHSYGYILEVTAPENPTIPSVDTISWSMATTIYYGGAGETEAE